MARLAVVLFNMGGPDRPDSIEPFLFNLFNDAAIIGMPGPLRWLLAKVMARRRAPAAREIYAEMGGASPLLELTRKQAAALQANLGTTATARVFIAMRYWHPMADETAREVRAFDPDEVVLLPLYPQYSTTTTASSLADWKRAAAAHGISAPVSAVCCYPAEAGLARAQADLVRGGLVEAARAGPPRVLFSAHGLPERVVERGDPYPWQVEQTARAVIAALDSPPADWVVCYQSRVGPLRWIGPSTEAELARAGRDGVPVVVVPIAFVSEHSETLVELDIEYREKAREFGVPAYVRVPAVGGSAAFIGGLAGLVEAARRRGRALDSAAGGRVCPAACGGCPLPGGAGAGEREGKGNA